MKKNGFEVEGLEQFRDFIATLTDKEIKALLDRIIRTAGLRYLELVRDKTPRRTGRLKNSLFAGGADSIFIVRVTKKVAEILVGTAVEYAIYVNDGYEQKPGQLVPGEWRGGTFYYLPKDVYPNALAEGKFMVLTGKKIAGQHMFDNAMAEMEADLPRIIMFEITRLFQALRGA